MKIKNLHQPYIFKINDQTKIVVSEIGEEKLFFKYGNDNVIEDYWKIKILDENYNLTTINTPRTFNINNTLFYVIAECNGFIDGNNISYIVGLHTKLDNCPIETYLVIGKIDLISNNVYDVKLLNNTRSAFIKNSNLYDFDLKNNKLTINGNPTINFNLYFENLIRLIGVQSEEKIILTGVKKRNLISFLYDIPNKTIKYLKNKDGVDVYKSSFLGIPETGTFAYAEKINLPNNISEYYLNIETGYLLQ